MIDFLGGRYDVLVCTTIVEIGLDIPRVNTILIEDAHLLGLAQLYQLRGRVGRADQQAYAYLLYPRRARLTPEAEQRLVAMREFVELGSGLRLAMRDLEIRGAGNLLGPEQHGHLAAVGFDLYMRLLDEAIRETRGEIVSEPPEVAIDLDIGAYLPDTYIPSPNGRGLPGRGRQHPRPLRPAPGAGAALGRGRSAARAGPPGGSGVDLAGAHRDPVPARRSLDDRRSHACPVRGLARRNRSHPGRNPAARRRRRAVRDDPPGRGPAGRPRGAGQRGRPGRGAARAGRPVAPPRRQTDGGPAASNISPTLGGIDA